MPAEMHVSVKPWLCATGSDADISQALTTLPEGVVYRLDGAGVGDVDRLLDVYRSVRSHRSDMRIALAARLSRTTADLEALGDLAYGVRLVKGAADDRSDSSERVERGRLLITLGARLAGAGLRPGICTGDVALWAYLRDWPRNSAEIETPALPEALAHASMSPQPLRIYLPYGAAAVWFGAVRLLRSSGLRRRVTQSTRRSIQ